MPTSTRLRGRIANYDAGTVEAVDRHLRKLTTNWARLLETDPAPPSGMRNDYHADVDLLLEARLRLQR